MFTSLSRSGLPLELGSRLGLALAFLAAPSLAAAEDFRPGRMQAKPDVPTAHLQKPDLHTGDVVLVSVPCFLCSLIESEENSAYSHAGVILQESSGISVLESWGTGVQKLPLRDFLARMRKATTALVLRPQEFASGSGNHASAGEERTRDFQRVFAKDFDGVDYDPDFHWEKPGTAGERFYCSEFVAKFLNRFLREPLPTKPMHFQKNREYWVKYFGGNPPDGEPGNSPGDLERSPAFRVHGVLMNLPE